MKQRFYELIQTLCRPWEFGASGTPWNFSTGKLIILANSHLEPDIVINEEGKPIAVYLSSQEIDDVMTELNFKKVFCLDPHGLITMNWEVELLPSTIL